MNPRGPKKTPNPYEAVGVRKADRHKIVSLDEVRHERTRRVEQEVQADGLTLFTLVIPTPSDPRPEDRFPLKELSQFPMLAEPVAHALLECMRLRETAQSRDALWQNSKALLHFLAETLDSHAKRHFTLADLTTAQVNAFNSWLKRTNSVTGREVWAAGTRRKLWGALRSLVDELKRGSWAERVPKTLQVLPWDEASSTRLSTPTEVIQRSEFKRIYQACVAEVVETIQMFEKGQRLIKENHEFIPQRPVGQASYKNLGIRLATINQEFPDILPEFNDYRISTGSRRFLITAISEYGGFTKHALYFYPSVRNLVPFVILLAAHSTYNPDTIRKIDRRSVTFRDLLGTGQVLVGANEGFETEDEVVGTRVHLAARKGRAGGKIQPRSFAATDDPDNPAFLLRFLERWTTRIRPLALPHDADRVFLFLPERTSRQVKSFPHDGDGTWSLSLKKFIENNGLQPFTLQQVRSTWIDFVHEEHRGDMRSLLAVGNQKSPDTINTHYTSDAARRRNDELTGEAVNRMWRDRVTGGRTDARRAAELNTDPGASTPGWSCLDPYSSPRPGQHRGRLCEAYGQCPVCPHALLDPYSPVSCFYATDLLARIDEARDSIAPREWLIKWLPVRSKLADEWLEIFDAIVKTQAKTLQLRRMPPVT